MKQLLLKEWREQFKIAVLGLVTFTVLLFLTARLGLSTLAGLSYGAQADGLQPLVSSSVLVMTLFFCASFGTLLGWLQIQAEKHPDLRAFFLHRPIPRATILHAKLLTGVGLYCLVAGLPLLGLLVYVLVPGHIPAPFEWAMVLPLLNMLLLGLVFYGGGLLAALRPARWYGSRSFGISFGIIAAFGQYVFDYYWQELLLLLISGPVLLLAVCGAFQTGGSWRRQSWPGKLALSITCAAATLILCGLAGGAVVSLFGSARLFRYSYYQVTKEGVVYKVTEASSENPTFVDLNGQPLLDGKSGKPIQRSEFNKLLPAGFSVGLNFTNDTSRNGGYEAPYSRSVFYFSPWRMVDKTLWYITRDGRLVGYDGISRRSLGTLELGSSPGHAAPERIQFDRARMLNYVYFQSDQPWYLASHQSLYQVDIENRTVNRLFSTTNLDGIGGFSESTGNHEVLVVTRERILLLAADGHTELSVPCSFPYPDYDRISVFRLEATNRFLIQFGPSHWLNGQPAEKLGTQVEWVGGEQDIIRRQTLPQLTQPEFTNPVGDYCGLIFPTSLRLGAEFYQSQNSLFDKWDRLSIIPVLVCVVIGWTIGQRYHFTFREQLGWAVFHGLLGIPGLLAFFSVQEWPVKEPCPACRKPRMVDREHCEHCGGEFAPPARNGTELFAPAAPAFAEK